MADDKRKLIEKELKRKNDFEKLSSKMQQKGYKMKNVNDFNLDGISWGYAVALPLLILCLIIMHELIHGKRQIR